MTSTASPAMVSPNPRARGVQQVKRVAPPRWRDARLAAGVLVLLGSVLIGARIIGAADRTSPMVAVVQDFPAGHVIATSDLAEVRVRLSAASALYVPWINAKTVIGALLVRDLASGELVPHSAVALGADPRALRDVPIVVDGLRTPKVHAGDLVDVYATTKPTQGRSAKVEQIAEGVEVVAEPPARESSVKVRLVIRVPKAAVSGLVRATQLSEIDVVEHLAATPR